MFTVVAKESSSKFIAQRQHTTAPHRIPLRQLTEEELFDVNRVTFREGRNHCRWPKEVIERFLAQPV
jgi:hypothetical protein